MQRTIHSTLDSAGAAPRRGASLRGAFAALSTFALAIPAQAHVKWFAPYIVEAPPQQIAQTLANRWFWTGILLVLVFFLSTRRIEKTAAGQAMLRGMDAVSDPLWRRLDDFVLCVIGAFFVAIFAVGGVYLTPDLKTPHEWVSWMQLLVAALVFSRRTRPLAAAGIILLWALALTEYKLFHLLDYLALGLAVAGYLVLEASNRPEWHKYRFEVLRWGVAIALMWSSLEKFAYPEWFYPLVEEKPFLTFGIPRDMFIPMAGVAEFTMGFGLLWTALIRRLSAVTLFVIFNAAVYPFGRMDMVGHALIMAIIIAIAADPTPQVRFAIRRPLWTIPASLVAAMFVFAGSYWGVHGLLYDDVAARSQLSTTQPSTHSPDPQHPHGPAPSAGHDTHPAHGGHAAAGGAAHEAYAASMVKMHAGMDAALQAADPDVAFVRGMAAHHQGAVDMARIQLQHGRDAENNALAAHIVDEQQRELAQMAEWLRRRGL